MRVKRLTLLIGILCLGLVGGTVPRASAAAAAAAQCPGGPTSSYTLYGVTITLGAPKRDNGGQDSSLQKGFIFQVVHATMTNHGKYHYKYNALDFAMLDAGAHDYQENGVFDNNLAQRIDTGTLGPGQSVSGDLAFVLPTTARAAAVRWIPTGLGLDDKGTNLDISDYIVRLPGYTGSAAQCPAGPAGSFGIYGVTVKLSALKTGAGTSTLLKPGYAFRVLHVTMTNHGKYAYEFNPDDFALMDAGARLWGQATAYDDNLSQPLNTGTLHHGQSVTGELAYALPSGLKAVAIRWQPTGLGLDDPNAHLDVGDYNIRLP